MRALNCFDSYILKYDFNIKKEKFIGSGFPQFSHGLGLL